MQDNDLRPNRSIEGDSDSWEVRVTPDDGDNAMPITPHWPRGLGEIKRYYGDPSRFQVGSRVSNAWPASILKPIRLPSPLTFAGKPVYTVSCHYMVLPSLERILTRIHKEGSEAWASLSPYAGCYCWRAQRDGEWLSTHSWGIAIDLGVSRNPRGQDFARFPPIVLEAFSDEGWTHGLQFGVPDPMHWQACSGY